MQYLPIFVDLKGRACLVVGGGEVALRKTRLLISAGGEVTVNAPTLVEGLAALERQGRIGHASGRFEPGLLEGRYLVIAATDSRSVNAEIFRAAETTGMLVNTVDDPTRCSFIVPAIVDRSPLVVAVSSGGAAPILARRIRQWLESALPSGVSILARLSGELRQRVKDRLVSLTARRRFWEQQLGGEFARLAMAGEERAARRVFNLAIESGRADASLGQVSLVGAGPGDPSLLTVRAMQRLGEADVVLHDRLVSPAVLALARRDAEVIAVGKHTGGGGHNQDEINAMLVRYGQRGHRVVRLKGGDPFIFGRGGEEAAALQAAGVPCEIVPGITAALGCAAATALPLTLRGTSQAVTLLTANGGDTSPPPDWSAIAKLGHTLAIYMGVGRATEISARLIQHGRPGSTPVAIIQEGTTPRQRVLRGQLRSLADLIDAHAVRAPTLIVIGDVAALTREEPAGIFDSLHLDDRGVWSPLAIAG